MKGLLVWQEADAGLAGPVRGHPSKEGESGTVREAGNVDQRRVGEEVGESMSGHPVG